MFASFVNSDIVNPNSFTRSSAWPITVRSVVTEVDAYRAFNIVPTYYVTTSPPFNRKASIFSYFGDLITFRM